MRTLKEQQQDFLRSVYQQDEAPLKAELLKTKHISPEDRIALYRRNVVGNLSKALRNAYPVTVMLVGKGFFDFAASQYIESAPPTSGNLDNYGSTFPTFLSTFQPLEKLSYVCEVAKLEWAQHVAYYEENSDPISASILQEIPQETLFNLTFTLHPTASVITSIYPIYSIWQAHQDNQSKATVEDLSQQEHVLVLRPKIDVLTIPINYEQYRFYAEAKEGKSLYEIFALFEGELNAAHSFTTILQQALKQGIFTSFTIKG